MYSSQKSVALGDDKRRLLLYVNLLPEEIAKLEAIELTVANFVFCLLGSSYHPIWLCDERDALRTIRLIAAQSDQSVLYEIESADLLMLSPASILAMMKIHFARF